MEHLRSWKRYQSQLLATVDIPQEGNTPVLCGATGNYLNKSNFEHWWSRWRAENKFPALKYHELRHTMATQLLANGVDVKTVQSRLGHSSASLTLNTYSHAVPENDEAAGLLIGRLFSAPEPDNRKPVLLEAEVA